MYRTMPLGIVLRRSPGVTRWAKWSWKATAVLPGAGEADWRELRRDGEIVEYHAATLKLELHGAETEAYVHGLGADVPCVYVVMRPIPGATDRPFKLALVTASPYEAQDYCDSAEEVVEKVAMTPGLLAWVQVFVEEFHQEEAFVKRRRDRLRTDLKQDGIGDPRIEKPADIYASPALKRKRLA
jgi:hypothetical protein